MTEKGIMPRWHYWGIGLITTLYIGAATALSANASLLLRVKPRLDAPWTEWQDDILVAVPAFLLISLLLVVIVFISCWSRDVYVASKRRKDVLGIAFVTWMVIMGVWAMLRFVL